MPLARVSPSLLSHNQGAGVKKKSLVSTIGLRGLLSSIISRNAYRGVATKNKKKLIFSKLFQSKANVFTAVTNDVSLYAWGLNNYGQFGNGMNADSNTPINIGVLNVVDLVCSTSHSLALMSNNKLYSWGFNQFGQLGNGTTNSSNNPVAVDMTGVLAGKTISQISVGIAHCLVLTSDNKLYSWGFNQFGQLGNGTNTDSNVPIAVDMTGVLSGKTIALISCGDVNCIVLTSDNKLYSWGNNAYGQLGDGTNTDSNIPVTVNMSGVLSGKTISIVNCGGTSCLVLTADNKLYSWGDNQYGQLGNGTNTDSNVPVAVNMTGVLSGKTITKISNGTINSLILTSDNKLYSWGDNQYGQLGNGTNIASNVPVTVDMTGVLLGKSVSQINCGANYSIVLTSDNKMYSWGGNSSGQLGDGTNTDKSIPVQVIEDAY